MFSSIFLFVDELLDLDESDAGGAAESALSRRFVSSSLRFVSNREKSGAFLDLTVSPKIFSRAIDVEAVAFAGFAHVAYQLLVFRICCAQSEVVRSDPGVHARGQMKRREISSPLLPEVTHPKACDRCWIQAVEAFSAR